MESVTRIEADLQMAAADGNIDPFKERRDLHQLLTPNKNTILHIYLTSLSKRSTDFIKKALGICPSLLLQVNVEGDTPFHIAARYGHTDAAEALIEQAKTALCDHKDVESGEEATASRPARQMVRILNKKHETALHEAARNVNSIGVVKAILSIEDPEFTYSANDSGETPLYIAADNSCTDIVTELLSSSQALAYEGPNGKTALNAAIIKWDLEAVSNLLEKRGSLAAEVDENGWTPLHYAAYEGLVSVVEKLLDKDISIAYIGDKDRKRTALHIAACQGSADVTKKIISKCPDCCELTDIRGWNVLQYAVISNRDGIWKEILQNSSLIYLLNGKDAKGYTPLHLLLASRPYLPYFIRNGDTDVFKFLKEKLIFGHYDVSSKQDEIAGWMKDLGSGAFGEIVVEKTWKEEMKEREEKVIPGLEKARESHLVAAALVATVTFAAAFTLPGGYVSDEKESKQGTPILSRNAAFKAFVITDAIAMVLSTSSVFIHFIMVMLGYKQRYYWLIRSALWFIVFAMGAMVVAFVTGTYAVLAPSMGLAIATCVIGLSFFLYVFYATTRLVVDSTRRDQTESGDSVTTSLWWIWYQSPFYLPCGIDWLWVKFELRSCWRILTRKRSS